MSGTHFTSLLSWSSTRQPSSMPLQPSSMPLFLFAVPASILFLNSSVHLQTVKHVSQEDSALMENHTDLFGGNDLYCLLKVSLLLKIRVKYLFDGHLEIGSLIVELPPDVDVGCNKDSATAGQIQCSHGSNTVQS